MGVESAAQKYFDKSARELTLPEAALLAGLPKAPSTYAPITSPGLARTRARSVIVKMMKARMISRRVGEAGLNESVRFADFKPRKTITGFEYALDYVYSQLPPISGAERSEIVVQTTLDARIQRAAHRIMRAKLAKAPAKTLQGAVLVLDNKGGVVAMVGGRSYAESQFNRATQALRQPGSAFKPIVFLAALETGSRPGQSGGRYADCAR